MSALKNNLIKNFFSEWPNFERSNFPLLKNNKRLLRRSVTKLAFPVIIEQLLVTLAQIVDLIMVGQLGAIAVAAVGLTNQPIFLFNGIFMGIGVGATVLVARAFGKGDTSDCTNIAQQTMFITFIVSLVLSIIALLTATHIVKFMGAQSDSLIFARDYLAINIPGLFFLAFNSAVSSVLRGAGETKVPMIVNTVANLLNIVGNYLLIFGKFGFPAMGVAGAALSTTLSRVIATVWLLIYISKSKKSPVVLKGKFKFNSTLCRRILKIGIPTSIERVVLSLGLLMFGRVVAGLGTEIFAAHTVALNVESISYMPGFAFGVAATTVVGQALGAEDPDLAYEAGWESWKVSALVMGTLGLLLFIFPSKMISLYIADPEIVKIGSSSIRIMALTQIPMSAGYTIVGALRGAGDTKMVLLLTLFSVWVVRLSLANLFVKVFGWGLMGAWGAMAIDWIVRCIVSMHRFRAGKWRKLTV